MSAFGNSLLAVCQKAKQMLQLDPRLIEIVAPVYVLGIII